MACKQALQVAVDRNFQRVHVELDSKEVVRQINQSSNNLSPLGHWVQEIKELLRSRLEAKVTWVRRSGNGAAHKLAKVAVGDNRSQTWVGVPRDFLLCVISDEIPCAS
uniref:RNase H type-1 domain-containing protein n=1 Tax=Hordeum vulgare subsp. vulgare TaxID=112509 RepID=A0A8I7BJI3_HORVV